MKFAVSLLLDVVLVFVFAAIGRASHSETDSATGILATAWPFAVAAIIGSLIALAVPGIRHRESPYGWRTGLVVLVSTVLLGMVLRLLAGGTAAWPFWIVAFVTLGVLLLGWRLVARLISSRRTGSEAQPAAAITSSDASKLE